MEGSCAQAETTRSSATSIKKKPYESDCKKNKRYAERGEHQPPPNVEEQNSISCAQCLGSLCERSWLLVNAVDDDDDAAAAAASAGVGVGCCVDDTKAFDFLFEARGRFWPMVEVGAAMEDELADGGW